MNTNEISAAVTNVDSFRRQREIRESSGLNGPVEDACLLSSPNDDILILGQKDEVSPLTILKLADRNVGSNFHW